MAQMADARKADLMWDHDWEGEGRAVLMVAPALAQTLLRVGLGQRHKPSECHYRIVQTSLQTAHSTHCDM